MDALPAAPSPPSRGVRLSLHSSSFQLAQTLRCFGLVFILAMAPCPGSGAETPIDYLTQIKPILSEKCYSCHGALRQESELRLETRSLMAAGGDSGEAIVPGESDASILIDRLVDEDGDRMPPPDHGTALKPEEVAAIRLWIDQGAQAPDEVIPLAPSDHWAFQRVARPSVPSSRYANPIDALLEAQRAERSLKSQRLAPRPIAIRRLYLDLVGLPPTRQQLQDERPWEEIVDELLSSPQHGERWARHWMDVWRYTDWYGLGAQLRNSQKHIWHWRDWIVKSLNDDKGYDRMVMEMLAGDELAPEDPEVIAGTGFLARNYYLFNRTTWLDSTIEHTGKAFLGLTLNCAKCHDHKYDPITHLDYYRFRAIFEPHQVRLDPVPGVTDFEKDGLPRVFDDHIDLETYLHVRGDPKNPDKETKITAGVPAILSSFASEAKPVALPYWASVPGARDYVQQDHLQAAREKVQRAESQLVAAKKKLAAAPTEQSKPVDQPGSFELTEQFNESNSELWELIGDGWQYRDGALLQTVASREPAMARLLKPIPSDFELTCSFTTTGGTTYKSITFRFDQFQDQKYANYVYTSAHEPSPKAQVAYVRGGTNSYPAEGRAAKPIKVGQQYKIRFAVRDTLVNVWLDDEFLIAYRLPDRKPDGFLSLSAFDATAAFDSVTVRSLAQDVKLSEANNKPTASMADAQIGVTRAEAGLAAAEAAVLSVQAIIAADNAKYRDDASEDVVNELAKNAAVRQAESLKKNALHEIVAQSDEKKIKAARDRVKKMDQRLAAIENGKFQYHAIRGSRKALETPAHKEADYPASYSPTSTGRRLALGKWVTSRDNPLTARVAVNHVWLRHFGEPLVESVFDFGLRAKRPRHAELLDLLAYEFMESGWSFRHLHRLIVTSEVYRLASSSERADAATMAADPTNQFYWRMNTRRMESQVVRDSLLKLAGVLDLKLGGPSIDPKQGGMRRSIYFLHSRDHQDTFLGMFDDADLLQCYRRSESIVPQQALALANSKLSIEMADKIATRIIESLPNPDRDMFIDATFEILLGRPAEEAERDECRAFHDQMSGLVDDEKSKQPEQRIRAQFVHAILNHNDFISIR